MTIKKHIPNAVSCANLFCGCLAVDAALAGNLNHAMVLILLSAIFDFFDGLLARALLVSSKIGKELDSLADLVSFGLAPAAFMYVKMQSALFNQANQGDLVFLLLKYLPFLIVIFSALRLAKFNIDERQNENFIGLPTPANTLLIVGLLMFPMSDTIAEVLKNPFVLAVISLLSCMALVMELPLFSLKFKSLAFKENLPRFILIAMATGLLLAIGLPAIALIVILYVALSLVFSTLKKS